ncbi:MAG: hydroxymethylbilane synthase, partial [Gammaproteobacteria bacterium]|nr:hydroxymethylbilane synthase [Gammaproteobacteria bacterium]
MADVRIATRKSQLAVWQASFVKGELERVHPGLDVALVGLSTAGDRWLDAPL